MGTKEDAEKALERIKAGEDFSKLAKEMSTCPSGRSGGSLGNFGPGQMVPAFDRVCFDPATKVGEVSGLVQTQFGYHLIIVDQREGCDEEKKLEAATNEKKA